MIQTMLMGDLCYNIILICSNNYKYDVMYMYVYMYMHVKQYNHGFTSLVRNNSTEPGNEARIYCIIMWM